jgi:hypothetical protein
LFKLLGNDNPDKRLRFWEIWKGITTPAEFQLVEHELNNINMLVTQAESSTKKLIEVAKTVGATV